MEKKEYHSNPAENRGWEIVKQLNEILGANTVNQGTALNCRKLLAEYFKLGAYKPSRLHSAILSCAVKMATAFPEFHFVPFLDIWGLENLRSEDSETRVGEDGKRFPSLVERMTKAYVYSVLFHPNEHLSTELEAMLMPTLEKKGYVLTDVDGEMKTTQPAIVTHVFTSDVRNRKMTFVQLMLADGEEVVTEVHTMTAFSRMRYEEMQNKMYDVVLRTSDNGKLRVEAAVLHKESNDEKTFPVKVGYVEHVDGNHRHIHVYDNESRHFVAKFLTTDIVEGQYVEFVPVVPKEGSFKSAVIQRVLDHGAEGFGYRHAHVTFVNEEYCAWELLPEPDGSIMPIMETGAASDVEPATKGYISKELALSKGIPMPKKGDRLKIIVFLKRGKDKKKRACVVDFAVCK